MFRPQTNYVTPAGYEDYPYIYTYDGSGLTDAVNALNRSVQLQGDADFVLRRIAGVSNVAGKFLLKNATGTDCSNAPLALTRNYPVLPEKIYPKGGQIVFDLYTVLRSVIACGGHDIYDTAQIVFQGVKRFKTGSAYPPQITPYVYYEVPYTYDYSLSFNTYHYGAVATFGVNGPVRVAVPVNDYDFELLAIRFARGTTGGTYTNNQWQFMLYDPLGHQMFSSPVNQTYINNSPATFDLYAGVFPVPTMVWPAGGQIVLEFTSMICNTDLTMPKAYDIQLIGVQRKPCTR